jgi:hypothetical protein
VSLQSWEDTAPLQDRYLRYLESVNPTMAQLIARATQPPPPQPPPKPQDKPQPRYRNPRTGRFKRTPAPR